MLSIQRSYSSKTAENILIEKGLYDTMMFSGGGPAGVFGFYVAPSVNLLRVLLNEFVTVITEVQSEYTTHLTIACRTSSSVWSSGAALTPQTT